jgi:hypothetical protein
MNREFYEKIIKTAQQAVNEVGISGDTTIPLNFDGNGNASGGTSQSCLGLTINIDAYMGECPDGSVFDIKLDTNYPQHFE